MRKLLLAITFFAVFGFRANAQLADGSIAPNWTLTDIDGNTWTLYNFLNQGKPVALDFSATWCGPCWSYHNGGALENLYDTYGPPGSDEAMVFFLEAELGNTGDCLYGNGGTCTGVYPNSSQGNWVAGTPYPIIDLPNSSVSSQYQISFYPTLYGVAPNRTIWEVGQQGTATWANWFFKSFKMEVDGVVTDATCPNSGGVELTVTEGFGNKSYEWSNGAITKNLVGVNAGTYSVVVKDANGYFIEKTFVVDGPAVALNLNNNSTSNITCFAANDGSASVVPAGGFPGYEVEWSNGQIGLEATGLGPGNYTAVVTDSEGCTTSEAFEIEEPEQLSVGVQTTQATCTSNNGTATLTGNGGTGNIYYQLVGGAPATTSGFFNNLAAATYEYIITDNNGCALYGQFSITSQGAPTAVAASSGPLACNVGSVNVTGTGSASGANITYLWTTTNGNIVSGGNTITATVNAPGTYMLRVTNTSTNCSAQVSTNVTQLNNAPISNAGAPQNLTCASTQATLNGTASSSGANYSYAWSGGNIVSGGNSNTAIVDDPGIYTLVVTDSNTGCTTSSSVNVTEDIAAPTLAVTNGTPLTCTVNSTEICATSTGTVTWNINGTSVQANCTTVSAGGNYTATALNAANGCTTTATAVVTQSTDLPQLSAQAPATVTCAVPQITIEGSVVGNAADFTINWATTNGNIVSGANTLTPIVNKGGEYIMTAVNNITQCTATLPVTVNENTTVPTAQFTSVSANGQLTLTNTSNGNNPTWVVNGETYSGQSVVLSFPNSGTYNVCLTVTNDCGNGQICNDVEYYTLLALAGTVTNAKCSGEASGSITASYTGGPVVLPIAYSWTGPNGFSSTDATISNLIAGVYICVLTDANGLSASSTYTVTEPLAIEANSSVVNATNNQNNGAIDLSISGGTSGYAVAWNNGMTGASISGLAAGDYSAVITDANGCQKTVGPIKVENVVGTEDPQFVSLFSVFPNPTINSLNVNLTTTESIDAQVRVINYTGKSLYSNKFTGNNYNDKIEVSNFPAGMYIIEISTPQGNAQRRFIVAK